MKETGETPYLLCRLGELKGNTQLMERAWELSGHHYARAKRHLGDFLYEKNQFAECIPHYKEAVSGGFELFSAVFFCLWCGVVCRHIIHIIILTSRHSLHHIILTSHHSLHVTHFITSHHFITSLHITTHFTSHHSHLTTHYSPPPAPHQHALPQHMVQVRRRRHAHRGLPLLRHLLHHRPQAEP